MTLLSLTTYNQLRGVLTVSPADLPDEVLAAYGLEDNLTVDLDSWAGDWQAIVDTGSATDPAPSAIKQLRLLRLYAKYFCASQVAETAPVFVLTKISDGSNEGQRSDTDGFMWLAGKLLGKAGEFKTLLLTEIGGVETTAEVPRFTSRVTPTRDPVTEARSDALE